MYQPLFQELPDSAAERFALIKQYAETWCGQTIEPPRGGHARKLAAAEARLGCSLPAVPRKFYASGLYDWCAAHPEARQWTPPGKLAFHEQTGSVAIMVDVEIYSIVPEQLGQADPLIVEHLVQGRKTDPAFKVSTTPTAIRFSEFLVREALLMADDLVVLADNPAALRRPVYDDGPNAPLNHALRKRLSRCAVAPVRGGDEWHSYEGPGVIYHECHPGDHRAFYAVLAAQTEERLAEVMAWGGGSDATEKAGNIRKADVKAKLKFTVEGERDTVSPKPKQVRAVLDRMTPEGGPGYCVLEGRGDDYAQVAGGSGVFTAEWREYSGGSFQHWKAGLPGQPTAGEVAIPTNGYAVTVRENERLSTAEVETILQAYLAGLGRPSQFVWRDISSMFART